MSVVNFSQLFSPIWFGLPSGHANSITLDYVFYLHLDLRQGYFRATSGSLTFAIDDTNIRLVGVVKHELDATPHCAERRGMAERCHCMIIGVARGRAWLHFLI
ncbi:hypothetical protein AZH11_10680 [Pseudomonas simiae]|nr:hypothetical protein AZH11_10680 [Pseudomonas simiae]